MNFCTIYSPSIKEGIRLIGASWIRYLIRIGQDPARIKQILFRMKLTAFLIVFGCIHVFADGYAQKITLSEKNASIEKVLRQVKKQSGYIIWYESSLVKDLRNVTISLNEVTVRQALDALLKDQNLTYSIIENTVVIKKKPKQEDSPLINQAPEPIEETAAPLRMITGTISDEKGYGLPGASILVKGTTTGTTSNADGKFSLTVPDNASILVVSFVGYVSQEIPIGSRTVIDVSLTPDINALSDVVVTALGIEKSKRSLSYATEKVDMEGITSVRDVNLGNALAGKIAGVSITASSGAAGVQGDPRIIIRGNRSINGNNQPLIVVDGVPYSTGGGGLQNINPDDVESMNVLKGPAAAALYGSSANNGVILVTTKKGKSGQAKVDVNSVTTLDIPYLYPKFQNEYGQGANGLFLPNAENTSWGPKMTGQKITDWTGKETTLTPQPNNYKDFFRNGFNATNSLTYSTGTDKSTAYFSYSNTSAQGILEVNKLQRHNFNLRLTTELVKKLNLDFRITYFRNSLKGKPVTGDDLFSPMHQLIRMPRSIRLSDIEEYSYYNNAGSLKQHVWAPNSTGIINPYWSMYGREAENSSNNVNSLITLKYDFTDWLYLQLRGALNSSNSDSEEKLYWDTQYVNSGYGNYSTAFAKGQGFNGDLLLGINKDLSKDLNLNVTLGAAILDNKNRSVSLNSGGLTTENKFAMAYAKTPTSADAESHTQKQSVYGMGQLGFRNYLFLDVTARNDWSSTLPSPYTYFYPSVGVTGVISDILPLPKVISYAKLRASYAEVGNDAGFAQIFQTYSSSASGPVGMLYPSRTKAPLNLIPERTKSWEAGAELNFFQKRLGLDVTWYKSNTYNQLVSVTSPASSGYSSALINAGNIQNSGVEVLLSGRPVENKDFNWDVSLNFSRNKNKVIELTQTLNRYQIASPNLSIGSTWIEVGKPYGEIYSRGFVRNEAGQILVDALGMPKTSTSDDHYMGNFNYNWRSGITNSFAYKNWHLSVLVDLNYGGVRQSATESAMLFSGTSDATLQGREGGLVVDGVTDDGAKNTKQVTAQAYWQTMGGRSGVGELFNYSATYSRLREFSLGYTIPLKSRVVRDLRISAVGRNLFFIYNGANWFDPDTTYDSGTNGQGAESAFLPVTRTLGVNIKLSL